MYFQIFFGFIVNYYLYYDYFVHDVTSFDADESSTDVNSESDPPPIDEIKKDPPITDFWMDFDVMCKSFK